MKNKNQKLTTTEMKTWVVSLILSHFSLLSPMMQKTQSLWGKLLFLFLHPLKCFSLSLRPQISLSLNWSFPFSTLQVPTLPNPHFPFFSCESIWLKKKMRREAMDLIYWWIMEKIKQIALQIMRFWKITYNRKNTIL